MQVALADSASAIAAQYLAWGSGWRCLISGRHPLQPLAQVEQLDLLCASLQGAVAVDSSEAASVLTNPQVGFTGTCCHLR